MKSNDEKILKRLRNIFTGLAVIFIISAISAVFAATRGNMELYVIFLLTCFSCVITMGFAHLLIKCAPEMG